MRGKKRAPREKLRASAITRYFRARFGLVTLALLLLIGITVGLVFLVNLHEEEHTYIINLLGRQRMLSQQMAKEASRMAAIYDAYSAADRIQSVEVLDRKLGEIRLALEDEVAQFEATLLEASPGFILYRDYRVPLAAPGDPRFRQAVEELRGEWENFNAAIEAVRASTTADTGFRKALIYVNENNEALLALSDRLTALAMEHFARQSSDSRTRVAILVICLVGACIGILVGTYRYVIVPYSAFYLGVKSLGTERALPHPRKRAGRSALMEEVDRGFAIMRDMVNMLAVINQGSSFKDTLHLVFEAFKVYIPYNYLGVATFVGYSGTRLVAAYGESDGSFPGLPDRLLGQEVEIGTTSLSGIVASNQPRIINDLEAHVAGREVRDYTRIILEEGIHSSITLPLVVNGKCIGFLFFSSAQKNVYTDMHVGFLRNIRDALSLSFEKDIFVDELVYSSTLALAKMAEARDEDTADHLDRMRRYTVLLATCMKEDGLYPEVLSPDFLHAVERFSPMHDIGKVGIRDNVLLKPGKLDQDEMSHMRTHTVYGANVLREAEDNIARSGRTLFRTGIRIAACHHERWDGTGYPSGLAGGDIPLEARIVSVADVLDALTTRRPYKEPFNFDLSADMIIKGAGSQFDPKIAVVFARHIDAFRLLYEEFRERTPGTY